MKLQTLEKNSKYLSYILRHAPDSIGISLDNYGWALISEIVERSTLFIDKEQIKETVENNSKNRFEISSDGLYIRALQGHTVCVNLHLEPKVPPRILYHGTVIRNLKSIMKTGIKPMERNHVHLSDTVQMALEVAKRYGGDTVILKVNAKQMCDKGFSFYQAKNLVWLTSFVPNKFIQLIN